MNIAANATFLCISLFLFVALFYGAWQTVCVDVARHKMFKARNAIFDIAARGDIAFNSQSYVQIRKEIELYIRFSHRANLSTMLLILFVRVLHGPLKKATPNVDELLASISNETVREEISSYVSDARKAMIYLILQRSLVLMTLFVVFVLFVIGRVIVRTSARHASSAFVAKAKVTFGSEFKDDFNIVGDAFLSEIREGAEVFEQKNKAPSCAPA